MTLKQKTVTGLTWSFIDTFARYGLTFFIGIILARLLSPADYGLVGMTTIFFAISTSFIDSGFGVALIRKQNTDDADLSSVFYFNLLLSIIFYLLLFVTAPLISDFFNEPKLTLLIRVIGINLIIGAASTIQQIILTKRIDFKLQTRISVISTIFSGIIAVVMAFKGFGVWSLVTSTLIGRTVTTILLWIWNKWTPIWIFSISRLSELFRFGSKLMVSSLINTIFNNIYYLVIGKYFSATELGYYTTADNFNKLPSENISGIVQRVSFPVLSSIQNDVPRLREAYKKLIRGTMLITFVLMLGLVAVARPMVLTLIGEKWEPSIIYLQLLCFSGMFYPLHSINLNMLAVKGRSDLFLRLEIIKRTLSVPIIVIGVFWGIKAMLLGMISLTLIGYFLNSFWSGKLIGYSFIEQIKDILPSFWLALTMSSLVFVIGILVPLPSLLLLIIQLITGILLTIGLGEGFHFKDYLYIKEIVLEKLLKRRNNDG